MQKPAFAQSVLSFFLCVVLVFLVSGTPCAKDDWGSAEEWGTSEEWQTFDDSVESECQASSFHGKINRAFVLHFDKDKDGKVSKAEFPGRDMGFKRFDADKDGHIDATEAPKSPVTEDARKDAGFVQRYDGDHDGKVSSEEFPGGYVGFRKYDRNKDGYINKTEAPKAPPVSP